MHNIRAALGGVSRKAKATAVAGTLVIAAGIGGFAYTEAAGAAPQHPAASVAKPGAVTPAGSTQDTICAKDSNNVPVRAYPFLAGCAKGYHPVRWYSGLDQITSFPAADLNTQTVLHNIGGSIRTGATDLGSVTLNKGVYDAKVLATFYRKVNTSSDPEWAGKQTYMTLVVVVGDSINPDFSNDYTAGGILLPIVHSTTLTVDPTGQIDQTISIPANNTPVHVMAFGYNDDSSSTGTAGQPGAGDISALLQTATFELKHPV
jgi:hypothetical protein